jgi:hypothetical protein
MGSCVVLVWVRMGAESSTPTYGWAGGAESSTLPGMALLAHRVLASASDLSKNEGGVFDAPLRGGWGERSLRRSLGSCFWRIAYSRAPPGYAKPALGLCVAATLD